jgi:hypothetical protein
MVAVTPLGSRGVSAPRSNRVLLARLPQAVQRWSEITDLYVSLFGQAPPGSRIFIWTPQVIHVRKEALNRTCSDMPPPEM